MHRVHASYLSFLYSLHKNCTSFLRPASDMLYIVMRFKYIFGNVFFGRILLLLYSQFNANCPNVECL